MIYSIALFALLILAILAWKSGVMNRYKTTEVYLNNKAMSLQVDKSFKGHFPRNPDWNQHRQYLTLESRTHGKIRVYDNELPESEAKTLKEILPAYYKDSLAKVEFGDFVPLKLPQGQDAMRVRYTLGIETHECLFWVENNRLLRFEMVFKANSELFQVKTLKLIAKTLQSGPDRPKADEELPETPKKSQNRYRPNLGSAMNIMGVLVLLTVCLVPIYLGAGAGYGLPGAANPSVGGSATGAFLGALTGVSISAVVVMILAVAKIMEPGPVHGIASKGGGAMMMCFLIFIYGVALAASTGLTAALGAVLGANRSRKSAQFLATAFSISGVFLAPIVMQLMQNSR